MAFEDDAISQLFVLDADAFTRIHSDVNPKTEHTAFVIRQSAAEQRDDLAAKNKSMKFCAVQIVNCAGHKQKHKNKQTKRSDNQQKSDHNIEKDS